MEKKSIINQETLYPENLARTLVRKKVLLTIFIILVPFLLLLLSYKANINLMDYTPVQKKVIDFLNDAESKGVKTYGVDSSTDIGLRVTGLGGIVSLLRFPVES